MNEIIMMIEKVEQKIMNKFDEFELKLFKSDEEEQNQMVLITIRGGDGYGE